MQQYKDLVKLIKETGVYKADRTGTGTLSIFGHQMRFDLSNGQFPLVTLKKTHLKSIIHELLWFLQGATNIRYLKENGVSIWDEWVKEGTAEYRDLTIDELTTAIKKHTKVEWFGFNCREEEAGPAINCEYSKQSQSVTFNIRPSDYERVGVRNGPIIDVLRFVAGELGVQTKQLIAGELGPVYGSQWRSWPNPKIELIEDQEEKARYMASGLTYADWLASGQAKAHVKNESIDQISNLIKMLENNPDSRRLIVSAWNPAEVDHMALPPCHALFQFYTAPLSGHERWKLMDKKRIYISFCNTPSEEELHRLADEHGIPQRRLSCQLYQRSCDTFLGVPFNIASYALLVMMVAQVTNMEPGDFVWTGGDVHLYSNHMEQVDLMLSREPHALPKMKINPDVKDLFGFKFEDFELVDYVHDAAISAPIAV